MYKISNQQDERGIKYILRKTTQKNIEQLIDGQGVIISYIQLFTKMLQLGILLAEVKLDGYSECMFVEQYDVVEYPCS